MAQRVPCCHPPAAAQTRSPLQASLGSTWLTSSLSFSSANVSSSDQSSLQLRAWEPIKSRAIWTLIIPFPASRMTFHGQPQGWSCSRNPESSVGFWPLPMSQRILACHTPSLSPAGHAWVLHPQNERGPQSTFLCGHPESEKTWLVSALVVWEEARVRLVPPSLAQQWPVARGHSGNRDTRTVPPPGSGELQA